MALLLPAPDWPNRTLSMVPGSRSMRTALGTRPSLELEIGAAGVLFGGVDVVLGAEHFVENGSDLVAALAPLDVQNILGEIWMRLRERDEGLKFKCS